MTARDLSRFGFAGQPLGLLPVLSGWLLLAGACGCTETPTPPPLRSLRGMSDSALLCLATRESDSQLQDVPSVEPRPVSSCPDFNSDDGESRLMHALVTQPETGEVALVNLQGNSVVDAETALPGINFLPVGAEPVSIASTPGGIASFVATAEPGKPAIYALPTHCVNTRKEDQAFIDITSWPACRLPAEPGPMEILVDPSARMSCDGGIDPDALRVGAAVAAGRSDCPADLALEVGEPGRRKLLVALPSLGQLAVMDAQAILDRPPGSFDACPIERTLRLQVERPEPALAQSMPADLSERAASCLPASYSYGPDAQGFSAQPVDFALSEGRLFVADQAAPVIHVVDTRDPCQLLELPALIPTSYSDSGAILATRRVAVSPRTRSNQQFVYAIEESSAATSGSVMMFDVSEGSNQRTPIVRPRSALIPHEPPDRIQFAQEAADVEFVEQRVAALDPVTGVNVDGIACDPRIADRDQPAAQYQPNSDLSSGAAPSKLHGVFAFVGLYGGQVAVVDVEDLDAACRRPISVNPGGEPDFRGCANDPNVDFSRPQTVSDEISCQVVQPHRARSSTFFLNDSRIGRAAALRQFPRLTSSTGRLLPTDQGEEGKKNPQLLAVDFAQGQPAQVFVGASLYEALSGAENELVTDPTRAERSSIALSLAEPRQFFPSEQFFLTYEGSLGFGAFSRIEPRGARTLIDDGVNGQFCSRGVQDVAATRAFARPFFPTGASAAQFDEFVASHADYVSINGDFPETDSAYWGSGAGASCGAQLPRADEQVQPLTGRRFCELWFGSSDVPTLRRDLRIHEAYQNSLLIEPRFGGQPAELLLELVSCCFPDPESYSIRAGQQWVLLGSGGGFQHAMTTDAQSGRCVQSCDPAVQGRSGRALEISCRGQCEGEDGLPIIGLAAAASELGSDQVCVVDDPRGGVGPGRAGEECVFHSGASRFAVYRGREASVRGMRFSWQLRGGFAPLTISLTRASNSIPERLRFVPGLESVMVIDGGTAGLGVVSLTNLARGTIN